MGNPPRDPSDGSAVRLDRQDPYLRLQSVTILVRDLDRSLDFFVNQLGFRLDFDARVQPGRPWVVVSPADGTANLVLLAPAPDSDQFKFIGHSSLVTFITEDLLAKYVGMGMRMILSGNDLGMMVAAASQRARFLREQS